jgi:hypothetical protein
MVTPKSSFGLKRIFMKRIALLLVLPALTVACSGNASRASLISGPTPVDAASVVTNDPFTFDGTELGRVTLTNSHATAMDYTFIVWRHFSDDEQVNQGQASYRLAPGETRALTVGLSEACGARYERNVFVGVAAATNANPFTMSDLRNYKTYAPGALWLEPACDAPAPPPSAPTPAATPTFCTSVLAAPPCARR